MKTVQIALTALLQMFAVGSALALWPPTWPNPNPMRPTVQASVTLSLGQPTQPVAAYANDRTLEVHVRNYIGATPLNARFLGWVQDGSVLTAVFAADAFRADEVGVPPQSVADTIPLPALAPGTYTLRSATGDGYVVNAGDTISVGATASTIPVTVLGSRRTGKFFMTAKESEVNLLLGLTGAFNPPLLSDGGGPHWGIAEQPVLRAWRNTVDAPSAAKPVCRFFHPTISTHFYSADEAECALLRRTSPFIDEGVEFRALVPVEGVCPLNTEPVYRLFSASLSNHRYTQLTSTVTSLAARGWRNEGVVFCSPRS